MKYLCTICSKQKSEEEKSIPAYKRYLAPHVKEVFDISITLELLLLILSGKFGLISASDKIPYYDYLLKETDLKEFIPRLEKQLLEKKATELDFYVEKEYSNNWLPYINAIKISCNNCSVALITKYI